MADQSFKLFVGNLNYKTSDEVLKKYYSKWGEVTECWIKRDKNTQKSKGFGFIVYTQQNEADAAMDARPHVIDERTLEPHRAAPKEYAAKPESHHTCQQIFVGNMKENISEEDLRNYFGQFGNIVKIELPKERNNPSKRKPYAFVTYDDYDPVDMTCHKKYHDVKDIRLDVTKSISRQDMAELEAKYGSNRENGYGGGGRGGGRGRGRGGDRGGNRGGDRGAGRGAGRGSRGMGLGRMSGYQNDSYDDAYMGYEDPFEADGWYGRGMSRNGNGMDDGWYSDYGNDDLMGPMRGGRGRMMGGRTPYSDDMPSRGMRSMGARGSMMNGKSPRGGSNVKSEFGSRGGMGSRGSARGDGGQRSRGNSRGGRARIASSQTRWM